MRAKYGSHTQAIYQFCRDRKTGIVARDITDGLGIPAKLASDTLNHMAMSGSLRKVRIPNRDTKRYRYFAVESYKPYERRAASAEGFSFYVGTPIAQMPLVTL